MTKKLEILELTEENFKEFGQIISTEGRAADGGDENFGWYEKLGFFENINEVSINILECKKRARILDKMEYHNETPEAVIPMGGEEVIAAFAPAGELEESKIKAFRIPGYKGVMVNIGVRHFIPHPTGDKNVNCLIIFKHATGANDLILETLSETYNLG